MWKKVNNIELLWNKEYYLINENNWGGYYNDNTENEMRTNNKITRNILVRCVTTDGC